jgi:hypothetical protein
VVELPLSSTFYSPCYHVTKRVSNSASAIRLQSFKLAALEARLEAHINSRTTKSTISTTALSSSS